MAIAKPDEMDGNEFSERVKAIADWFSALNPYDFGGSILKIEGENFALKSSEFEPLYCLAVSSKRYALFNLADDRIPIFRKVSAHGLGHLVPPYTKDDPPSDIPPPPSKVLRSGVERWHCDYWFQVVSAGLAGKPDMVPLNYHPALSLPAVSRYGASAPNLLRWFEGFNEDRSYRDQVKPFGFLLSLRAKLKSNCQELIDPAPRIGRPPKKHEIKPVAPFEKDLEKLAQTAFDRESGEEVSASSLQTYREALVRYHLHPESKFQCGNYLDKGTTERRHIRASGIRYIGKEANAWEQQAMLGRDGEFDPDYGLDRESRTRIISQVIGLQKAIGIGKAARSLGISANRLRAITNHHSFHDKIEFENLNALLQSALSREEERRDKLRTELKTLALAVQEHGLRGAARRLSVDPSNLSKQLKRWKTRLKKFA